MFLFGKKIAKKKVSYFETLSEKWTAKHRAIQENLWKKHAHSIRHAAEKSKHFAAGSLAGLVMLASPGAAMTSHLPPLISEKPFVTLDNQTTFLLVLSSAMPKTVQPLTPDQEKKVGEILTNAFGHPVSATLDGYRLNRSYGYIGQEQHLARYPGDTMDTHLSDPTAVQQFYEYGMAPGLGAWGYFARSQSQMTQEDALREKYYIAVQTFLAPGYNEHTKAMSEFFKYHKMLVVNPDNGKAVVAVIGDSGPAEWTGKSLGGSPEVMQYLNRVDGAQKGGVLYFFIDDKNNTIPLGPVTL